VFASLYGTLELMPADLRDRVRGVVVNKFRGDESLLAAGVREFEDRTGVPVLAVLPHDDPGLPEEDSVSLPAEGRSGALGGDDDVPAERSVTVGVPRLPHVSNFTDLEPLARVPGVRVRYVPLDATLGDADAVVVPGTKNTVDDLLAAEAAGLDDALAAFSGPVVGVCGGYQMLGERITNASVEGTGATDAVDGVGLLPVETRFSRGKRVRQASVDVEGVGPIDGATGVASGYEIHAGETTHTAPVAEPLEAGSAATPSVLGTYLHGVFGNGRVRDAFVSTVFESAGRRPPDATAAAHAPYDAAADLVADLDLSALR
jgi:adenosylcobyric acid synthase